MWGEIDPLGGGLEARDGHSNDGKKDSALKIMDPKHVRLPGRVDIVGGGIREEIKTIHPLFC